MEVKQKKIEKSQLELGFELSAEEFKHFIDHALEHLKKHVKVDGFRPGQAPNKLIEDKIKPESLLMEAGDIAVRETYLNYIKESKLEPVGQPEVSIIKIAQGSPFVFKAIITVLPNFELPDYKEIAIRQLADSKGKEISVTEEEVLDSINYLQKTRAKFTEKNPTSPDGSAGRGDFVEIKYSAKEINGGKEINDKFILGEGGFMAGFEDGIVSMKTGEEKEISVKLNGKDTILKVKIVSLQKMELPEINDEFAKQLGTFSAQGGPASGWDTLVALKTNMKEGILAEKTEAEKQRRRGEILEKIAEKAKFEMPVAMVEYEQERLLEDLKNKITQNIKISFEEYLASIKKTEAEIKETYKKEAEKRLRGFLVLRELGKKENVETSEKEIAEEVEKYIKNYNLEHAGHNHGEIDREQLKEYTKGVIQNEKIFQILEKYS